jgi:hypothetical protein
VLQLQKNLRPVKNIRDAAFKTVSENGNDQMLVDDNISNSWDEEEWQ